MDSRTDWYDRGRKLRLHFRQKTFQLDRARSGGPDTDIPWDKRDCLTEGAESHRGESNDLGEGEHFQ